MKGRSIDITGGRLGRDIFLFSVPIIVSNVLQVLFNVADVAVAGRFAGAEEIKKEYAGVLPYGDWLRKGVHSLNDLKQPARRAKEYTDSERTQLCKAFGFTHEDVRDVLDPQCQTAAKRAAYYDQLDAWSEELGVQFYLDKFVTSYDN